MRVNFGMLFVETVMICWSCCRCELDGVVIEKMQDEMMRMMMDRLLVESGRCGWRERGRERAGIVPSLLQ